jgi:hypothetical protein
MKKDYDTRLPEAALVVINLLSEIPEHCQTPKFWQKFKHLCPADLFSLVMLKNQMLLPD